jgi:hypothetical protein
VNDKMLERLAGEMKRLSVAFFLFVFSRLLHNVKSMQKV